MVLGTHRSGFPDVAGRPYSDGGGLEGVLPCGLCM